MTKMRSEEKKLYITTESGKEHELIFDTNIVSTTERTETIVLSTNSKLIGFNEIETEKGKYIIINDPYTGIPCIFNIEGKLLLLENEVYTKIENNEGAISKLFTIINSMSYDNGYKLGKLEMPEVSEQGISLPFLLLDVEGIKINTGIALETL